MAHRISMVDFKLTQMGTFLANYPQGDSMIRVHLINEYLKTRSWDIRNGLLFTIGNLI